MTMRSSLKALSAALLICAISATETRADGFVSPFWAVNFGGDAGGTFNNNVSDRNRTTFGAAVGFMSRGIFGFELDLAYTNKFYGEGAVVGDNSLLTIMPGVIMGIPFGGQQGPGIRPYVTAGVGIIRRELSISGVDVFDGSDRAYSLGFGVMGYFSNHVGFRADYKFVNNFAGDEVSLTNIDFHQGIFDFSRAAIGVLFRF